jgi:hypothetical protein
MKRLVSLFLLLSSVCHLAQAQEPLKNPVPAYRPVQLYLLGGAGPASYRGDLAPSYQKWGGLFGLALKFNRHRWVNPVVDLSFGRVSGQNPDFPERLPLDLLPAEGTPNRFFSSTLVNASFGLHFNLLKTERYQLYLSQGLGFTRFGPRDDRGNPLADQLNTRAFDEALPTTGLILPTGLGGAYFFPNGFGLGAEVGWLNPRTDYLDNLGQLGNPEAPRDNVLRLRVNAFAPLKFQNPEEEKQRKERRTQRREQLEQQLKAEKAAQAAEEKKAKAASQKSKPKGKKKTKKRK